LLLTNPAILAKQAGRFDTMPFEAARSRHAIVLQRLVEVDMKNESRVQSPAQVSPGAETQTEHHGPARPSIRLAGTPQLTAEEYERVLQQVTSDLFLSDEPFRKSVVLREVRKVVLGWGTAIGITSLFAIGSIYLNARDSLKQTVSIELSKAVKEHVSARSELLNESIKSLTNTAVGQIVHVQKELESAQAALDKAEKQLAVANQQSIDLQRRIASISETLSLVQQNAVWLGDAQNAQRVAGFIRTLSNEQNGKAVGDLLYRVDRLEAFQIQSQIVSSAAANEQQRRAAADNLMRMILTMPPERQGKVDPHKSQAFDKMDAYIQPPTATK
jgi:ribosomal protein S18 acetylase RimI-like enzyme